MTTHSNDPRSDMSTNWTEGEATASERDRRQALLAGVGVAVTLRRGTKWLAVSEPYEQETGSYQDQLKQWRRSADTSTPPEILSEVWLHSEESPRVEIYDPVTEPDLLIDFVQFGRHVLENGIWEPHWPDWEYNAEIVRLAGELHRRYGPLNQYDMPVNSSGEPRDGITVGWFASECVKLATVVDVHNAIREGGLEDRKDALGRVIEYIQRFDRYVPSSQLRFQNEGDLLDDDRFGQEVSMWLSTKIAATLNAYGASVGISWSGPAIDVYRRTFWANSLGGVLWVRVAGLVLDRSPTKECAWERCPVGEFVAVNPKQTYCHPKREGRQCKRNHDRHTFRLNHPDWRNNRRG